MTVAITYPVDALVSYHYYAADTDMAKLVNTGRLRLIGDSGAFSAMTQGAAIDLGAYAAWVTRWQPHLFWAASLDVIGDPVASHRNWKTLRDRHDLHTIPTVHAGAGTDWLDVYGSEGVDFVGLGGMAGTGQATKAFRWAVHLFRHARVRWPGMRFHLWGVTNRQFLDALPCYSADSSGILGAAYRYASLRLFDPTTGRHHQVQLRKGQRGVYRLASLLRRIYGVAAEEIETSHPGNRTTLIKLAAASTQQYAAWLQQRHRVPPPVWGIQPGPPPIGPRRHLVDGSVGNLVALAGPDGPRIHAAFATAGRSQADEAVIADDAPDGTRVHVVAGANQPPDILPVLEHDGPTVHMADTAPEHLVATTREDL